MTNSPVLEDLCLIAIESLGTDEFSAQEVADMIHWKSRPSVAAISGALLALQCHGLIYALPGQTPKRRGRPRAQRWRVAAEPLSEQRAKDAVLLEWEEFAKDPTAPTEVECHALYVLVRVCRPELLSWPVELGTDRREVIGEWVRVSAQSPKSTREVR